MGNDSTFWCKGNGGGTHYCMTEIGNYCPEFFIIVSCEGAIPALGILILPFGQSNLLS
jgi:hypothetical protein